MKNPLVSIIIPTRNSERYIKQCLLSIKKLGYKNIEIIVVDQNSTDNTVFIAKELGARVFTVTQPIYYSPPSYSRNLGTKHSKGDILYHLDSDMFFKSDVITEALEIFSEDSKIGSIIVHEKDIARSFWGRCKAFERTLYIHSNIESARIVRKKVFLAVGGYDESISTGEDFEIHRRYINHSKIGYCATYVCHDITNFRFFSNLHKKYQYGISVYKYFQKTHRKPSTIMSNILRVYLKNYQKIISHPFLFAGALFQKSTEGLAVLLGYLRGKYI